MKITWLRVTALWPRIDIGAIILVAMLTPALSNLGLGAFFVSPAKAQSAQPRQFAITIKQRKVLSGPNVIRVTEGDSVEIVLTGDEQTELHLHGYDIMLSLAPNVPGKIAFNAKIDGRFPLEAHRFGTGAHTSSYHAGRPLLYVEVHPR